MIASRTRHLVSPASSKMAGSRDCDNWLTPITERHIATSQIQHLILHAVKVSDLCMNFKVRLQIRAFYYSFKRAQK